MTASPPFRVEDLEPPPWLYARLAATPVFRRFYQLLAADLDPHLPPGARLLDVGAGPGGLLTALAVLRPDLKLTGLDLSPKMLSQARRLERSHPLSQPARYVTGDVHALPFRPASFDVACATMSLHHWTDPVQGLAEMARVLAPHGRASVYELNRDALPAAVRAFAGELGLPALLVYCGVKILGRHHGKSRDELASHLAAAGLASWDITPCRHLLWRAEFRG
jgi:SAM-dependent methyltransferase